MVKVISNMSDIHNIWMSKEDEDYKPEYSHEEDIWAPFRVRVVTLSHKRKPLVKVSPGDEPWCPISLE